MKSLKRILSLWVLLIVVSWATMQGAQPKYIFYFIGDGMGLGQVQVLRTYHKQFGAEGEMHFYQFPVSGIVTTYSADNEITDSAAAGTALATGSKTRNGMIGMNADTFALKSVAYDMQSTGRGVAILTSVCIDDATPASFYATQPSRHNYHHIALQGAESGFDLLAGAYFRDPYGKRAKVEGNVFDHYAEAGYTVVRGRDGYELPLDASRVLWLDADSTTENRIGYAVDGDNGDMTLPQMVRSSIDYMHKKYPRGFFMMAEGGAIDHMGHSNDPSGVLREIEEFDDAVRVAYEFYKQHPRETLIIITADHETGGLSLGVEGNGLPALGNVQYATVSKGEFGDRLRQLLQQHGRKTTWSQVRELMADAIGLGDEIAITAGEEGRLMVAFQELLDNRSKDVKTLYASFDNLTNEIYKLYSLKFGMGWTTYSHSGNPVPIFAIGVGADKFDNEGWLDNTDIPRILRALIGRK